VTGEGTPATTLRTPRKEDAAPLRRLLAEVGRLERNSCYAYLLLCTHFATTCLVAEQSGQIVGFVLAYRPPSDPESLFVWQVGVAEGARGAGLARHLLRSLLEQPACRDARFMTATVSPDNAASLALFRGFARARGALCEETRGFCASLFDEPHPEESLLRVGPLKGRT
jgi:L-2,4-diaminobutyric acid acetyltransferase